jgi:hypothetical protein
MDRNAYSGRISFVTIAKSKKWRNFVNGHREDTMIPAKSTTQKRKNEKTEPITILPRPCIKHPSIPIYFYDGSSLFRVLNCGVKEIDNLVINIMENHVLITARNKEGESRSTVNMYQDFPMTFFIGKDINGFFDRDKTYWEIFRHFATDKCMFVMNPRESHIAICNEIGGEERLFAFENCPTFDLQHYEEWMVVNLANNSVAL